MDATVALIVGLVIGLLLGAVAGAVVVMLRRTRDDASRGELANPELVRARHDAELAELGRAAAAEQAEIRATAAAERAELSARLAAATASLDAAQQQIVDQQAQYRDLVDRHRAEARAREEQAEAESKVLQALAPVAKTLQTMETKVAEIEQARTKQHGELSEQLRASVASEDRLRRTADSLASALNSNATRGVWGETQLRRVAEAAGMIERVDFDVQSSISTDSGTGRPDMVVHLPGGKAIAVDAKAPFTAYLEASAIPRSADGAEAARRDALVADHVKALRGHVTALAARSYWDGLDVSPEFVIAFIPSESLVSAAMQADPTLMEFAFGKRVALASPVTLWSVLKSIAYTWQQDALTEDAKRLFDLSRELYGRLATMGAHIDKLGRSLTTSVKDYNKFVGSLERQVLPSARKLAALDESKVLPSFTELDETPRSTSAAELVAAELDVGGLDDAAAPAELVAPKTDEDAAPAELVAADDDETARSVEPIDEAEFQRLRDMQHDTAVQIRTFSASERMDRDELHERGTFST